MHNHTKYVCKIFYINAYVLKSDTEVLNIIYNYKYIGKSQGSSCRVAGMHSDPVWGGPKAPLPLKTSILDITWIMGPVTKICIGVLELYVNQIHSQKQRDIFTRFVLISHLFLVYFCSSFIASCVGIHSKPKPDPRKTTARFEHRCIQPHLLLDMWGHQQHKRQQDYWGVYWHCFAWRTWQAKGPCFKCRTRVRFLEYMNTSIPTCDHVEVLFVLVFRYLGSFVQPVRLKM